MKDLHGIKDHLKSIDDMIRKNGHKFSMTGFVLKHGRIWKPTPKLQREFRLHRGGQGMCFMNAAKAALMDRCLTYVEGYAAGLIPIIHAWCVTARGEVVEVTWEDGVGVEYYGIPFKKEFLRDELLRNKHYGLIDQWHNKWPLLMGKYPKKDWLQTT